MIDSGATGNFLATRMVKSLGLPTQNRKKPYTLEVVDGTLLSDKESGLITSETPLLDHTSKGHFERIKLDIVPLGRHQIILGVPWLRRHNPSIDWKKGIVQFRKEITEVLKVNHDHTWGVCRTPWMYSKVQCGRLDEPWWKRPSLRW